MAYVKTWSTKEQVLKDLARASGKRFKKKEDLNEEFLVIGDAPPPVIAEDEDDAMHILFGDAASKKSLLTEDTTPDLLGIQQMLRMMQEFNSGDDDDDTNAPAKSSDCVIAISKVSKLNPNVQEFIPKSVTSPSPSTDRNNDIGSPNKSTISNKDASGNVNTNVTQTVDVVTEDSSKNETEVNNLNENTTEAGDYQDIATTLKNKISDAAKSDSFEFKKQKNVAIATLLRLYATHNASPKKSTEPLKLITPEYFEGKKDNNLDVKVETITEALNPSTSTSSSTPEPKDSTTTLPSCSSNSTNSTPLDSSPKIKIDPEIRKSIDKVNKWLEEPTKRKSPAVFLGPVAFKRKEPMMCKSPASDRSQTAPKVVRINQQYQPSKYAEDLGKQYLERSKIMEAKNNDVTWSNLDEVLKQKDLVIKKRLDEQASASESNDDSGSPLR